jgi:hypothetical protein
MGQHGGDHGVGRRQPRMAHQDRIAAPRKSDEVKKPIPGLRAPSRARRAGARQGKAPREQKSILGPVGASCGHCQRGAIS